MEINASTMKKIRTYVPVAEKVLFVESVAGKCVNAVQVGARDDVRSDALPTMYMENAERKARYMMGALLMLYLGVDFDGAGGDPYLPSWDDYDRFAGDHILNQIERLKTDVNVRGRCFDLLQDYRLLEKMLNAEVYGRLQVQNDPVSRLLAYMQTAVTPEYMNELAGELRNAQSKLISYTEGRKNGVADGG